MVTHSRIILENSMDERGQVGYSPEGCRGLDTTEHTCMQSKLEVQCWENVSKISRNER